MRYSRYGFKHTISLLFLLLYTYSPLAEGALDRAEGLKGTLLFADTDDVKQPAGAMSEPASTAVSAGTTAESSPVSTAEVTKSEALTIDEMKRKAVLMKLKLEATVRALAVDIYIYNYYLYVCIYVCVYVATMD